MGQQQQMLLFFTSSRVISKLLHLLIGSFCSFPQREFDKLCVDKDVHTQTNRIDIGRYGNWWHNQVVSNVRELQL